MTFEAHEGYSSSDSLTGDQENCAVNVQIMLQALYQDILQPNGYFLDALGFDHF